MRGYLELAGHCDQLCGHFSVPGVLFIELLKELNCPKHFAFHVVIHGGQRTGDRGKRFGEVARGRAPGRRAPYI